jgi:hypothetical protein
LWYNGVDNKNGGKNMAFAGLVAVLPTILPLVIQGVETVERIIRGRGRGAEKREVVIEEVLDQLRNIAEQTRNGANVPNFQDYRWIDLLLASDEAIEHIGAVIDSVVALMNFLGRFDNEDDE